MTQRHGIVSPWAGLEPSEPSSREEQAPRFGLPDDAMEDHRIEQKHYGDVVIQGRGFEICISVPKPNPQTPPNSELGKAVFGACLQEFFKTFPRFESDLRKQSLYRQRPLGPVTVLEFDATTIFAKAGTLQPDVGYQMAIDRLVLALFETVGWEVNSEKVLQTYRIELVRRA